MLELSIEFDFFFHHCQQKKTLHQIEKKTKGEEKKMLYPSMSGNFNLN